MAFGSICCTITPSLCFIVGLRRCLVQSSLCRILEIQQLEVPKVLPLPHGCPLPLGTTPILYEISRAETFWTNILIKEVTILGKSIQARALQHTAIVNTITWHNHVDARKSFSFVYNSLVLHAIS